MKSILLFTIGFLAIYGCSRNAYTSQSIQVSEKELPQTCEGLTNLLESRWLKHKSGNFYFGDKKLYEELKTKYLSCIKKLNKQQVLELFGKPNEVFPDRIYYYLNEACNDNFQEKCYYLVFYFYPGDEGVVVFIREERILID